MFWHFVVVSNLLLWREGKGKKAPHLHVMYLNHSISEGCIKGKFLMVVLKAYPAISIYVYSMYLGCSFWMYYCLAYCKFQSIFVRVKNFILGGAFWLLVIGRQSNTELTICGCEFWSIPQSMIARNYLVQNAYALHTSNLWIGLLPVKVAELDIVSKQKSFCSALFLLFFYRSETLVQHFYIRAIIL